jgi:DNA-binding response OmpR family regulator
MRIEPRRGSSPGHALSAASGAEAPRDLLVIDDDTAMRETLACYFESRGFKVALAANLTEAMAAIQQQSHWRLVLSDYHLPDGTGAELHAWLCQQPGGDAPFVLMSGSLKGEQLCGYDYLAKPFSLRALEERLSGLLARPHSTDVMSG